jgi:hypothetical protein
MEDNGANDSRSGGSSKRRVIVEAVGLDEWWGPYFATPFQPATFEAEAEVIREARVAALAFGVEKEEMAEEGGNINSSAAFEARLTQVAKARLGFADRGGARFGFADRIGAEDKARSGSGDGSTVLQQQEEQLLEEVAVQVQGLEMIKTLTDFMPL